MTPGVVIIGAGHAGIELADALRACDYAGSITVVDQQTGAPYQRPPLSKELLGGGDDAPLPLRSDAFFEQSSIRLRADVAVSIDRAAKSVSLASGDSLAYDTLVLATGARARRLSLFDPAQPAIHELRSVDDARALSRALTEDARVVVVGGGFIGLELAAVAAHRCAAVTVIERGTRVLGRVVSPEMSDAMIARHRNAGVDVRLDTQVEDVVVRGDGCVSVCTSAGDVIANTVVVGVGVEPRSELAERAGLAVRDGIVVDASLRTSDHAIFAIGDVARFPGGRDGRSVRLESVPNATDQARHLAKLICGAREHYRSQPWFWSVQGADRVQIVGIASSDDDSRRIPARREDGVVILRHSNGLLRAVETLNEPGLHVAARKVLAAGPVPMAALAAVQYDLRAYRAA